MWFQFTSKPMLNLVISIYKPMLNLVISIYQRANVEPCDFNLPASQCWTLWFQFTNKPMLNLVISIYQRANVEPCDFNLPARECWTLCLQFTSEPWFQLSNEPMLNLTISIYHNVEPCDFNLPASQCWTLWFQFTGRCFDFEISIYLQDVEFSIWHRLMDKLKSQGSKWKTWNRIGFWRFNLSDKMKHNIVLSHTILNTILLSNPLKVRLKIQKISRFARIKSAGPGPALKWVSISHALSVFNIQAGTWFASRVCFCAQVLSLRSTYDTVNDELCY